MNIETLLEAAKFVELQEGQDARSSSPRDDGDHELSTSPDGRERSPDDPRRPQKRLYRTIWSKSDDETPMLSREYADDDMSDLRRSAGTREVHNKLEKNRRAHLKECFELVKKQLPPGQDDKKCSNLNILHNAIKYIQVLRRKDREFEHEMEQLAREKIALQQRLAHLKKELSADWDHIDFNALIPEESEDVKYVISTNEEHSDKKDSDNSTSSLSTAPTESALPTQSNPSSDETDSPGLSISPKNIPSDGSKMISITSRLEPVKGQIGKAQHIQLPVLTSSPPGQFTTALVSPTIQLVASPNIRMMSRESSLALRLSPTPHNSSTRVALIQKGNNEEPQGVIHTNGIRAKGPVIAFPNGAYHTGLPQKNSLLYKPSHQPQGFTHVVAPLTTSHGTLVAPVTVVSKGNPFAHILTAPSGKVVTPLNLKPIMSQYLVKPSAAMVVVSQNSAVSQTSSK